MSDGGETRDAVLLRGVAKRFGGKTALEGLDLSVPARTVFGFLGPNGAGKTTTLRILLGLVSPDAGDVEVLGRDPRTHGGAVRAEVGVLLDHDGHYDRLTATQNLAFHASAHGLPPVAARARVEECLRSSGLWERRGDRVATFSKGMRQKLAVARALLHRPRLLLLDEPFTGLDPTAAIELRERIRALAQDEGTTVVLTTHDLHHVEKVCDRIAVLQGGRVVASGETRALLSGEGGSDEIYVAGGGALAALEAMRSEGLVIAFRAEAGAREGALVRATPEHRKRLATELVRRGVLLEELSPRRTSLEETFVKLVSPLASAPATAEEPR